ncbi:MAG TPA: TMEM175 family protein [Gammaproteobacteria bacterium]|nr:TMEM175 family protein [Gammaproteobacteria bacterium]
MGTERLQAFSDGVLAIIITIMVLELAPPHATDVGALRPLLPAFLSYILSFIYVGIYWNNHHHLLYITERLNGAVLWANLHLLFWLSLFPFSTAWMGENSFAPVPTAIYGCVLLMAALAWWVLQRAILAGQGDDSLVAAAMKRSYKEMASPLLYGTAIGLAFVEPWIACAIYAAVALIWFVPDRRVEHALAAQQSSNAEHRVR